MSLLSVHRHPGSLLPDVADLWNSVLPPDVPMFGAHLLRVEDTVEDGRYVIRAEIPGIDPADAQVSVQNGQLTIKAERTERKEDKGRSEFRYGSFVRTVALPPGAQEDAIDATYAKGILTVTVPMSEPQSQAKSIEVKSGE
ncbi:Hsp20/alpha crystallin family protein [Nocardia otitidiscaviarum]|uniref:Hsp20/alpha crystallin family protein n=1 Tax=Nocardia otitidiscaviarum TaxID=1823 RepID=A0A516NLP8_9NOCA|nr:Hsp20/alpha crystallin family protein [Nocardia otitidiscaviarum]MCP9618754.1 Hsp20/alpha crystallin family protein [Nocardia otitidiscaviarum]QDP79816.1 Hsp20/alpha crystallin family protein [Nocardia otitidiscaviarum]